MARIRSPNYPAMSLPEAIGKVKAIHAAEQHLAAPREVMARHMGYNGINGSSLKAMSALLKYGLLEKTNDDRRKVSDLALKILHPRNEAEKRAAIVEAASAPSLFQEIEKEWPGGTPSDENLKAYLIRRNFAADAIPDVIKAYRGTAELVTQDSRGYDSAQTPQKEPMMQPSSQADPPKATVSLSGMSQARVGTASHLQVEDAALNNPQIVDRGSTIFVSGLVDRKGLDRLIKKLMAYKAVLDASEDEDEEAAN